MKTNIANGVIKLGTVLTHDNKLLIGDKEKGFVLDFPMPEGLYEVKGITNYFGEVERIEIDFRNASYNPLEETVKISDFNVGYGIRLSELSPSQKEQRMEKQLNMCINILESIPMDGSRLFEESLTYYLDKLKQDLRVDDEGLLEIISKVNDAGNTVDAKPEFKKVQWITYFIMNQLKSRLKNAS